MPTERKEANVARPRIGSSGRGLSRGAGRANGDVVDPDDRTILRVVIADDSRLIVAGIRRALEGEEIEVVGCLLYTSDAADE